MPMRSWFRTHRKQIITHTSIIVGFVLLIIFVTEPLFDRLEIIPGEAQLCQLQLPAETNDIRFSFGQNTIHSHTIEIRGRALIEGYDVDLARSRTYVVLKSDRHTYIFDTAPREIQGGGWAGFLTSIPLRKIARGEYILGLYITRDDIQALQYTDKAIVKVGNIARLILQMSKVQEISLPPESQQIKRGVDICGIIKEENEIKFMDIIGWAFIEGQSAEDSKIYMVLKSETANYIFDTLLQKRPDVTTAFVESGLNLDHSGFIARIPLDTVEVGAYELGIYIKKGDIEALQYTGRVVEF